MAICQSIFTPIIKPIDGLCNLSCSYCYTFGLKKCTNKDRMRPETLKAAIDFFCCNQDSIEFIWHGGEPLLAGLEFYRHATKLQNTWKQKGKRITNFIQTNATLITPEWAYFFAEHNFFVGVSLDGPKKFHNRFRRYSTNNGSYNDVMRGIDLLRKVGVFNGIICGVSTANYKFPEELFNFLIVEDIKKLKFARIKNIGYCNNISSLTISLSQYTDFMITIFNLWLELDDPEVEIRDIQSVVNLILGGNKRECIYMNQCNRFVTIYHDGSIYSCDSFPKIGIFNFGCVSDKPIVVRSNPQLKNFQETLKKRSEHCKTCNWYFICNGGCAKDYYAQFDSLEPINEVCENKKRYFEYISAKISAYNLYQTEKSHF